MYVDDFILVMSKVKIFKMKLVREGIYGEQQQIILKIYMQELTNRINTNLLGVI